MKQANRLTTFCNTGGIIFVFLNRISRVWLLFLLLVAATVCVWGQTVTFAFVWDDFYFIRDLPSIRSLQNIPEMFYRLDAQSLRSHEFVVFRPLRNVLYALLYFLGGKAEPQPWLYHLANVLGHGATVMMLFATARVLLRRFGKNLPEVEIVRWAFFVALAFAVHPVVSEVVCWAKSLDDILATFFTLAALHEVLQPPEQLAARRRGLLFFALAVYAKESAVPFALIVPAVCRGIHQLSLKKTVQRTVPFLLVAVVYMAHRHLVIGRSSQTAPISGSYAQTLVDMLPVASTYCRLMFGVPPFCIDYSYLQGGEKLCSPLVLSGLLLLLCLAGGAVLAWRSERGRLAGFGLLWTGLFLLPVANVLPMMQYLAERFLYLPLIGWLLALAGILMVAPRAKQFRMVGLGVVLCWGITAWQRSWIWRDELTLFTASSLDYPQCRRIENNAVSAIFHLPQIRQGFTQEHGNLELIEPVDAAAMNNGANTLNAALEIYPENPNLLSAMAMLLAAAGKPERALLFFEKAARQSVQSVNVWLNCARAALAANQIPTARAAAEKAQALDPKNPFASALLSECQQRAGSPDR